MGFTAWLGVSVLLSAAITALAHLQATDWMILTIIICIVIMIVRAVIRRLP